MKTICEWDKVKNKDIFSTENVYFNVNGCHSRDHGANACGFD